MPHTSSVGAFTRWMRFFSPLSGIGQMNFPVAPIAHVSRTRAAAASASSAAPNSRVRRVAVGIAEDAAPQLRRIERHPVDDRIGVAPETDRAMSTSRRTRRGAAAATSHAIIAAERVTDQRRLLEAERVEQLVVAEDEVPQPVELVDVVRRARRRARDARARAP